MNYYPKKSEVLSSVFRSTVSNLINEFNKARESEGVDQSEHLKCAHRLGETSQILLRKTIQAKAEEIAPAMKALLNIQDDKVSNEEVMARVLINSAGLVWSAALTPGTPEWQKERAKEQAASYLDIAEKVRGFDSSNK